jgi:hypothetical protein
LWLTVVGVSFLETGCDAAGLQSFCIGLSDWGWPVLDLPPGALEGVFSELFGSAVFAVAATIVCAAALHAVVRRFVPRVVPWRWTILAYLACLFLTGVITFISIYLDFFSHRMSFWDYLRGAARLLLERRTPPH